MANSNNKVKILDTTLRDGVQAAPSTVPEAERKAIVDSIKNVGFDIVEAGFAAASQLDKNVIDYASNTLKNQQVASLARTTQNDIDEATKALDKANHPLIHTFIATSPIHMEKKLEKSPEEVREMARNGVSYAKENMREKGGEVQFSCEDATRSNREFLKVIIDDAIKAGADIINIPDTVGYFQEGEMRELINYLRETVPNIDNIRLSVHCHDDLGRATANSLEGVLAGARQIEGCINGVGERAGNASLEEIVASIKARPDRYEGIEISSKIDSKYFGEMSELVSRGFGMPIQPNKAIVGSHAFAHMSGIHQHGDSKDKSTYQIMQPEMFGWTGIGNRITTSSGKAGFRTVLNNLGLDVTNSELEKVYRMGMEYMVENEVDLDRRVLYCIVTDKIRGLPHNYSLDEMNINIPCLSSPSYAKVFVRDDRGNMIRKEEVSSYGPISALYEAIEHITGKKIDIDFFSVRNIGRGGRDSKGETIIGARDSKDNTLYGWGLNHDTIKSAEEAYFSALNKID